MTKYETDETFNRAYDDFLRHRAAVERKPAGEVVDELRTKIILQVYRDRSFKSKIDGMMGRNHIPLTSGIQEDVLQEIMVQLWKYNARMLIEAYCDRYSRVLGLAVRIATRCGFGKMGKDIHQNASVAKQMTYKSNITQKGHLSTTDDEVIIDDKVFKLPPLDSNNLWEDIRSHLTPDEVAFLDFLLDRVFSGKYKSSYPIRDRQLQYTYNEYRILRLSLESRIREIIKHKIK